MLFSHQLMFFLMPVFCLRISSKTTSQVTMVPYSPVAYCSFKDFSASTNLSSLKCLQHSQLQFVCYVFMAIRRSLCFWRKGTEMTSHSCHIISIVGTLCEITPPALVCYVSSGFYILKPFLSLPYPLERCFYTQGKLLGQITYINNFFMKNKFTFYILFCIYFYRKNIFL